MKKLPGAGQNWNGSATLVSVADPYNFNTDPGSKKILCGSGCRQKRIQYNENLKNLI